jgi:hypothetical protein
LFQYGLKFNQPKGSFFETSVSFTPAVLVIQPDKESSELEILEWRLNNEDMCPACGEKPQSTKLQGLIANGKVTTAAKWPWHVSLYKRETEKVRYICGGSILNKKWIISAGELKIKLGKVIKKFEKIYQQNFPVLSSLHDE